MVNNRMPNYVAIIAHACDGGSLQTLLAQLVLRPTSAASMPVAASPEPPPSDFVVPGCAKLEGPRRLWLKSSGPGQGTNHPPPATLEELEVEVVIAVQRVGVDDPCARTSGQTSH